MEYWKLRDKYAQITGIDAPRRPEFTGSDKTDVFEAAGALLTAARKIQKDIPVEIAIDIHDYCGEVKIAVKSKAFSKLDASYDSAYKAWCTAADSWVKDNLDPETGEQKSVEIIDADDDIIVA